MFCPNCGTQVEGQPAFCPECGARMTADAPQQPQPQQNAPQPQQPVYQQPVYQQPVQQPVYQQPQPVYQQPVYQQPVYQQQLQQPVRSQPDYSGPIKIRRWPAGVVVFAIFALITALIYVVAMIINDIATGLFSRDPLYCIIMILDALLPALVLPITALASRRGNLFVLGITVFLDLTFYIIELILGYSAWLTPQVPMYLAKFTLYTLMFILFFVYACIPIRHKTTVLPAIYLPFALILIILTIVASVIYIVNCIRGEYYLGILFDVLATTKVILINVVFIIAMFASRRHKAIVPA